MTRAEALRRANDLLDALGDDGMLTRPCWNCDPSKDYLQDSAYVIYCSPVIEGCGRFFFKGVHVAGGQHATD